jgi:hypothetical protein
MLDFKEIEKEAKEEMYSMIDSLKSIGSDPAHKIALKRIAEDMINLTLRSAKGEDVSLLFKSLKAELALRGSAIALRAQAIVQETWTKIINKVIATLVA